MGAEDAIRLFHGLSHTNQVMSKNIPNTIKKA
jgi:hypothetical protein